MHPPLGGFCICREGVVHWRRKPLAQGTSIMLKRLPPLSDLRVYRYETHKTMVAGILKNVGKEDHCIDPPDIDLTLIVLLTLLEQASYPIQLFLDNFSEAKIVMIEQRVAYREQATVMLAGAAELRDMIDFRETPKIIRLLEETIRKLLSEVKMRRTPFGRNSQEVEMMETEIEFLKVFIEMLEYKLNPLVQNV